MSEQEMFPYSLEYLHRVTRPTANIIVAWPDHGFGVPLHCTSLERAIHRASDYHGMGYGAEGKPSQIQLRLGEHVVGTVTNGRLELIPEYECLRPDQDNSEGEG